MADDYSGVPQFLSLGAGVQSSCLAMLAASGEIGPMPQAAIFADTQDEPAKVYEWLDWLEKQLPFAVHRVTKGKLSDEATELRTTKSGRLYARNLIPVFTLNATTGEKGHVGRRPCTADFKIRPILSKVKELVGDDAMKAWRKRHKDALRIIAHAKKNKLSRPLAAWRECQSDPLAIQWIGISTDEMRRMKQSQYPWAAVRWPLIEKRMNRSNCLDWFEARGLELPPRSACRFCPFHSDTEWRRLQSQEPEEFVKAIEFEKQLQSAKSKEVDFNSIPFLHQSCRPLDEIDFRSDVEQGQVLLNWQDECEGMCGI
jgi:hypothetical protein